MCPPTSHSDVSPDAVAVAKASYQRCCAVADFFACFYRNFFHACPAAAPRFAATDFERQNKLLQHAIGLLLSFPGQAAGDPPLLRRVAKRHSRRDLDIPPEMYPPFVDALIQTVREHDPEFGADTEAAWRRSIAPGVQYMLDRY